jgi:hypothetical protein
MKALLAEFSVADSLGTMPRLFERRWISVASEVRDGSTPQQRANLPES